MSDHINSSSFEILYRVSRELTSSLDLHTVLERVLSLSTQNLSAERASLVVLDSNQQPVDAAMIFNGLPQETTLQQMEGVLRSGLAGWVLKHREPALISNTDEDERWLTKQADDFPPDKPKSVLCFPLIARETLVGVVTIVHPQVNFFSEEHFRLQQAIADLAGVAISNAKLYEEVEIALNRYQDLFTSNIDPIFITNFEGKILEVNSKATEITETPFEELKGSLICTIFDEKSFDKECAKRSVEEGDASTSESLMRAKTGRFIPVEVHTSQIDIQGNKNLQWILRDITEKKKLDELREDLSAMIYHDLRSPLANIISSIELMQDSIVVEEDDQMGHLFEIANRSTGRMQRLISSLLDISRLEGGHTITSRASVDVEKIIDEAIETASPQAKTRRLTFEKIIPASIPPILVDEDMIRRVVINLVENACKFSSQGSTIIIGAKVNGEQVSIWVDDQGPGIPDEVKVSIFDKFVRLKTESPVRGLGLGLAFCKMAIQAHGGEIWVENLEPGGSRFIFNLPVA